MSGLRLARERGKAGGGQADRSHNGWSGQPWLGGDTREHPEKRDTGRSGGLWGLRVTRGRERKGPESQNCVGGRSTHAHALAAPPSPCGLCGSLLPWTAPRSPPARHGAGPGLPLLVRSKANNALPVCHQPRSQPSPDRDAGGRRSGPRQHLWAVQPAPACPLDFCDLHGPHAHVARPALGLQPSWRECLWPLLGGPPSWVDGRNMMEGERPEEYSNSDVRPAVGTVSLGHV